MLYNEYLDRIAYLKDKYDFLEIRNIGSSVMGRDIFCIEYGDGARKVQLVGQHHGMEHVSCYSCFRFLEDLCKANISYENTKLFIIPCINPDGAEMQLRGGEYFYNWQANARGVDLNHNYDALWHHILPEPGPTRFGGRHPFSEPETQIMRKEAYCNNFDRVLALHSQGEEIYYDFNDIHINCAEELAKRMSEVSGYTLAQPEKIAIGGGYKDWFIKEFGSIGMTIELGKGENPLHVSEFETIYKKAKPALEIFCNFL